MKAVKQVAPHPMVAKVAHLPKIQQVKAVKAQVKTEHPHKDKVDKAMAILKAAKVKGREAAAVAWLSEQEIESVADLKDMKCEQEFVKVLALPALKAKYLLEKLAEYKPSDEEQV